MRRYHPKFGIPPTVQLPQTAAALRYSRHAVAEANRDRMFDRPRVLSPLRARLFEVVTDDQGRVIKLGYRTRYDERRDICLVVDVRGETWAVLTCWANDRADRHRTLRAGAYDRPGPRAPNSTSS